MKLARPVLAIYVELLVIVAEQRQRLDVGNDDFLINIYLMYLALRLLVRHAHDIDDVERVHFQSIQLSQLNRWFYKEIHVEMKPLQENLQDAHSHLHQVRLLLVLFGRLLFVRYLKKATSMQFAEAPRHLHMIYFSLSTLAEIEMIAMMTLEFCSGNRN